VDVVHGGGRLEGSSGQASDQGVKVARDFGLRNLLWLKTIVFRFL
jgi:hypothetical protein